MAQVLNEERNWSAKHMRSVGAPREAMECFKRALIGADPYETTIHLKLAKLHNDLDEFAEAASYHRRVVDVCRAASTYSAASLDVTPHKKWFTHFTKRQLALSLWVIAIHVTLLA